MSPQSLVVLSVGILTWVSKRVSRKGRNTLRGLGRCRLVLDDDQLGHPLIRIKQVKNICVEDVVEVGQDLFLGSTVVELRVNPRPLQGFEPLTDVVFFLSSLWTDLFLVVYVSGGGGGVPIWTLW